MKFKLNNMRDPERPLNYECVLECLPCGAPTKSGGTCRNSVCIGRNLCHLHRKVRYGLKVKKSGIRRTNMKGLWTTRAFKKNDPIGMYLGQVINHQELVRRYGPHEDDYAPYTISEGKKKNVDSACLRGLMSMANSAAKLGDCNAKIGRYNGIRTPIEASRPIPANREIILYYGKNYWTDAAARVTHETK